MANSVQQERLIVAFDLCSSSDILEELTLKGDIVRIQTFLTKVKRFLREHEARFSYEVYKFTGDGWILLFPPSTNGMELLVFLRDLCGFVKQQLRVKVLKYLDTPPKITGITFGIEKGPLSAMRMYNVIEYVGRALNIACRLQSAVGDRGGSPAYKALVSSAVYSEYFSTAVGFRVVKAKRILRNIRSGATFRCRKIELLNHKGTA